MTSDPANSCSLFITVHSRTSKQRKPTLSGRFQFEDHIRCIAAKQVIQRSRNKLRVAKMARIAKMLRIPVPDAQPSSLAIPARPSHFSPESSVISLTPTPDEPSAISLATAHRTFTPPSPNHTPTNNPGIEMSNLCYSTLFQPTDEQMLDSSIRLASPSREEQTVYLNTNTMGVSYHRDISNSRSPSCEVDTLELSDEEEGFSQSGREEADEDKGSAVGYSITKLEDSPVEQRKKEQVDDLLAPLTMECGALTIIVSNEQDEPIATIGEPSVSSETIEEVSQSVSKVPEEFVEEVTVVTENETAGEFPIVPEAMGEFPSSSCLVLDLN